MKSNVYCNILRFDEFLQTTGIKPKSNIVKLSRKIAKILIKKQVVELAPLQRELEEKIVEKIPFDESPEVLELLKRPDLLDFLVQEIQKEAVGEAETIKTILVAVCLGKVLNKNPASANLCLTATSGAGKDFIVSTTLKIIPEFFLFERRRVSQKALDYALSQTVGRDWNDFIVYLEDVSNAVANSESVKTLMTANPNKENTVSIVADGEVKNLVIKGKPLFIMTSASIKAAKETQRRLPFCFLDETPEQTLVINQRQAELAATGEVQEINSTVKQFYCGLNKVQVIVPFAPEIAKRLGALWQQEHAGIILRTVFPRFIDYIKASAALHQQQREKDEKGNIIAEPKDYDIARIALLKTTSNALMIPLGHEDSGLVSCLINDFKEGGTVEEIALKYPLWNDRWLRQNLDRLVIDGFVRKEKAEQTGSVKPVAKYFGIAAVMHFQIPAYENLQKEEVSKFFRQQLQYLQYLHSDLRALKNAKNEKEAEKALLDIQNSAITAINTLTTTETITTNTDLEQPKVERVDL